MATTDKHLHYLDELSDYKVSSGYSDVHGWNVKDKDNRVIGKVDNLLVNLDTERVVYLDVDVDQSIIDAKYDPYTNSPNSEIREFVNKEGQNHVIIPIGLVDIDDDKKYVYTETINYKTFAETKRYRKGENLDREYEIAVLDSYDRKYRKVEADEDRVREIVRDEIKNSDIPNAKETELKEESKIRNVVRDELNKDSRTVSHNEQNDVERHIVSRGDETLSERRDRLHRDEFDRDREIHHNENKQDRLDFDHDNDGNPNISDPDYYQKKGRDIKNADYDNDDDGNPNITDPNYYEEKARDVKNADYDHDNDGNPNITDPDYYEDKLKGRDTKTYRDHEEFYKRREFDDSRWSERRK